MPRALLSFGLCTVTGLPSKVYSPASKLWMPAMPLIRVLLPAPLSPTNAVTRPGRMSISTPRNTSTAPKLLLTARSESRGAVGSATGTGSAAVIVVIEVSTLSRVVWPIGSASSPNILADVRPARYGAQARTTDARGPAPRHEPALSRLSGNAVLGAGGRKLSRADGRGLLVAVGDNLLDVVLEDRLWRGKGRRDILARHSVLYLRRRQSGRPGLVAVGQSDRQLR